MELDKMSIKSIERNLNKAISEYVDSDVYLDNSATTKPDKDVLDIMDEYQGKHYGNASCEYPLGIRSKLAIEEARGYVLNLLHGEGSGRVYFTSGASESNNWIIKGVIDNYIGQDIHIITTQIEHPSIIQTLKYYSNLYNNISVTYLGVDKKGLVNIDEYKNAFNKSTKLVSIIWVNNEIGVVQNIEYLSCWANLKGAWFHSDATQALGKINIDVEPNIDFLSISSHKIHGPKGVGALYIKNNITFPSFVWGGKQENAHRAGTENVPGIMGFSQACYNLLMEQIHYNTKVKKLYSFLIESLEKINLEYKCLKINGAREFCTPYILNFSLINEFRSDELLEYLYKNNIYCSSGSACACKDKKPSSTILALKETPENALNTIRISLSKNNTECDIGKFLEYFEKYLKSKKGN